MSETDSQYINLDRATTVHRIGTSYNPQITTAEGDRVVVITARGRTFTAGTYAEHALLVPAELALFLVAQITMSLLELGMTQDELEAGYAEKLKEAARTAAPDGGRLVAGCPSCGRAQPECVCEHTWAVR